MVYFLRLGNRVTFKAPMFPSPLTGEGQGGGETESEANSGFSPPSQPSPVEGEGAFFRNTPCCLS
jgi:hypothetical protein